MGRAPCCDKNGLKKGPWTPEEDQKLIDYIQKSGYGNWRTLPKNAGLQRCGKSCRLRWTNYLRPDIKRGRFSFEEEETIIQLHSILGNKWSAIASRLPGRTDNEIKNYWNTHIRKRLLRMGIDPVTHSPRLDLLDLSSILRSSIYNPCQMNISRFFGVHQPIVNQELLRIASSIVSSQRDDNNFVVQNCQENQLCNNPHQIQHQFEPMVQPSQFQIPNCTTLTGQDPSCVSFSNEANLLDPNNVEQYTSNVTDFGSENSQLSHEWPSNLMSSNLTSDHQDYMLLPYDNNNAYYDQATILDQSCETTSTFMSNNGNNNNFSFATPSSSPTPLNSNNSATYINSCSSTEDERESYCSTNNILKFEIPDFWDASNVM